MATIGLDRLYYAKITENDAGEETYGTPEQLAKAISADLSVELAEATLYADDGASEIVKEFKSGTLSLGIDDIGSAAASDLTGATIDKNKVLISASEDGGDPVAVGFRAKKSNGKYKYYLLLAVPREIRYSGDEPCHQGRQHYFLYADHRGYHSSPQQGRRRRQAPVESGGTGRRCDRCDYHELV